MLSSRAIEKYDIKLLEVLELVVVLELLELLELLVLCGARAA